MMIIGKCDVSSSHGAKHYAVRARLRNVCFIVGKILSIKRRLKMKFRAKPLAYSLALAGLACAAIDIASAAATPGGGWTEYYYSDASHTVIVGNLTLSCPTGYLITTGEVTAFVGPKIYTTCPTPAPAPSPPSNSPPGAAG